MYSINPEWLENGVGRMYAENWLNIIHIVDNSEVVKLINDEKPNLSSYFKMILSSIAENMLSKSVKQNSEKHYADYLTQAINILLGWAINAENSLSDIKDYKIDEVCNLKNKQYNKYRYREYEVTLEIVELMRKVIMAIKHSDLDAIKTNDIVTVNHKNTSTQADVDLFCEIEKLSSESKKELEQFIKLLRVKDNGILDAKKIKGSANTYIENGVIASIIPDAVSHINQDTVIVEDKIIPKISHKKRK